MSAALSPGESASAERRMLPTAWWGLGALLVLAASLRLSTLGLQSFWYDEAFTPVHVLHSGLGATLRAVVHSENSPPLWYLLEWADARVLGEGEVALRLPSALAGVATVPVAWAIGRELAGPRCALIAGTLVAVNPLFVWYSQEARVYALFALTSALALLCFLRARSEPTPGRMAAFALTGSVALLTHYFAVFLLVPMALWLLRERDARRLALPAVAAVAVVGAALVPLVVAQGGHGTQWIGRWPLSSRVEAIPQYYLTGYSGAPLGHSIELLVALPFLVGLGLALARVPGLLRPGGAGTVLAIAAAAILAPIVLALLGADYMAPRNLLAAMIPLTGAIAVALSSPALGAPGTALAATAAAAFLAISVDVDLSPRLQRGNWRGVARALAGGAGARAITTVELGGAPLEYYLPHLRPLARGDAVTVQEIDQTGYSPLRASAGSAPAPGFRLSERLDIDGLISYRFRSLVPQLVSQAALRRHVITLARPEVLVSRGAHAIASRGAQVTSSSGRG